MSTLIPSLGSARFDARGELRLAERLKDCLEDNAWVWHNIPVGPFGRHPDFVALHPVQSIVVLEVKDWRLDTIGNASAVGWGEECPPASLPLFTATLGFVPYPSLLGIYHELQATRQ